MSIVHGSRRLLTNLYSIFGTCGEPSEFLSKSLILLLPLGFSFIFFLFIFTKRYCSSTKKGTDSLNHIDYHNPPVLDPSLPSHFVAVNDTRINGRRDCVICLGNIHKGSDDDEDEEEEEESDSSDKGSKSLPGCGHEFHVECIEVWLKACPVCPICRRRVSGDEGEEEGGGEETPLFASYGLRMDYGPRFDEVRESLMLF